MPIFERFLANIEKEVTTFMQWLCESNVPFYNPDVITAIYRVMDLRVVCEEKTAIFYSKIDQCNKKVLEIFDAPNNENRIQEVLAAHYVYYTCIDIDIFDQIFNAIKNIKQHIIKIKDKYEAVLASGQTKIAHFCNLFITFEHVKERFDQIQEYQNVTSACIFNQLAIISKYYDDPIFFNGLTQYVKFCLEFSIFEATYFAKVLGKYIDTVDEKDLKSSCEPEMTEWCNELISLKKFSDGIHEHMKFYTETLNNYNKNNQELQVDIRNFNIEFVKIINAYSLIETTVSKALNKKPTIANDNNLTEFTNPKTLINEPTTVNVTNYRVSTNFQALKMKPTSNSVDNLRKSTNPKTLITEPTTGNVTNFRESTNLETLNKEPTKVDGYFLAYWKLYAVVNAAVMCLIATIYYYGRFRPSK